MCYYVYMPTADLLIDASGPEIRHRTGLSASDDFVYLRVGGANIVFANSLEYDHFVQKAKNLEVELLDPYYTDAKRHASLQGFTAVLDAIFTKYGVESVRISKHLQYRYVRVLEQIGIVFEVYDYTAERLLKTAAEIEYLKQAQVVANGGFDLVKTLLKNATIQGEYLEYEGEVLTSERVKTAVQMYYLEHNYSWPAGLIVASREQGACPHHEGSGPLYANEAIVVDMFPRSTETGYYADMTRTFVKGTPSSELVKQHEAVQTVQAEALHMVQVEVDATDIHNHCVQRFKELGFTTNGTEGFIHSTGHGLGLELHELPRIGTNSAVLQPGMVMTIEPGLYYKNVGGVRLEDVVVLHPNGKAENITNYNTDWVLS